MRIKSGAKGTEIELFWGGFKALHLLVFYTPPSKYTP